MSRELGIRRFAVIGNKVTDDRDRRFLEENLPAEDYLGWLPFWKRSDESNGWWQRMLKSVIKTPGTKGVLILGMLNGILPCGLVYESLFIAGASGNPWVGGLGMFLFGIATLPALVVFGVGAQMISFRVRKWFFWAGGIFVIFVGILLIIRGVNGLGLGTSQPTHMGLMH
jgi:sulfite exporter TauE/SafE